MTTTTHAVSSHDGLYWARNAAYARERAAYKAARDGVYDLFPGSRVREPSLLTGLQRQLLNEHREAEREMLALRAPANGLQSWLGAVRSERGPRPRW
jgi:hypothetical protein